MIKEYILQNWALILILAAFVISLRETIFLNKKRIRHLYGLIAAIFALSIVVFAEFSLAADGGHAGIRAVLMAVRYSATPLIISAVIYILAKGFGWTVYIPALILTAINLISIPTGIVFRIGEDGVFERGPLGLLPFIAVGAYSIFMMFILIKHSKKQMMEIVPIAFIGFAFATGLVLPFVYQGEYSRIFCTTIAVSLYVYYEFMILVMTKRDPLTGLFNRQAFYSFTGNNPESITALISIDMNGLKTINDRSGHAAGDEALKELADCFLSVVGGRQRCYRIGGDEFVIICRQTTREETVSIAEQIRQKVSETPYSCAVGYSHTEDGAKSVDDLLRLSDNMMYAEKARYYADSGKDRRMQS